MRAFDVGLVLFLSCLASLSCPFFVIDACLAAPWGERLARLALPETLCTADCEATARLIPHVCLRVLAAQQRSSCRLNRALPRHCPKQCAQTPSWSSRCPADPPAATPQQHAQEVLTRSPSPGAARLATTSAADREGRSEGRWYGRADVAMVPPAGSGGDRRTLSLVATRVSGDDRTDSQCGGRSRASTVVAAGRVVPTGLLSSLTASLGTGDGLAPSCCRPFPNRICYCSSLCAGVVLGVVLCGATQHGVLPCCRRSDARCLTFGPPMRGG